MSKKDKKSSALNLNHNITSAQELADLNLISQAKADKLKPVIQQFPMSIPPYYLSLIEEANESDPIYKMCVASLYEKDGSGREDTSGESDNTIMNGLQHKYKNTVLLLATNVCAMYCRHCFRKRMVGLSEEEILKFSDKAIEYVKNHTDVDNVLITGGDAFLISDKIIEHYLKGLSAIKHLKFIRFGTRTPVVMPKRITKNLCHIIKKYSQTKTIYIVTQFNHPKEITAQSKVAIRRLIDSGATILNQTVLLAEINDKPKTLARLFNMLVENHISPYYLFQCRPVKGVKENFAVPLSKGVDITDKTKALLSGVAKRFKYCLSHVNGKMEILGFIRPNVLILKQHQAKDKKLMNKLFTIALKENQTWIKDDVNYNLP